MLYTDQSTYSWWPQQVQGCGSWNKYYMTHTCPGQSSAKPSIWFEINTKTCLDFWFLSIPIPRHVLISNLNWDQYQDSSWFVIHFKINTKTSLDFCFHSRPIPRVLFLRLTMSISIPISIPMEKIILISYVRKWANLFDKNKDRIWRITFYMV